MKKIRFIISILILGLIISPFFQVIHASDPINLHFFHSDVCSNCNKMEVYFIELLDEYPEVNIVAHDIFEEADLFSTVTELFSITGHTPTVVIQGVAFEGYNEEVEKDIENALDYYKENSNSVDIVQKVINSETINDSDFDEIIDNTVILPIIGEVNISTFSMFISAVLLGLFDGFNPCAMWILIFLITLLINHKDRKRMWIIGFTFIVTSALVYFLIMFLFTGLVDTFSSASGWFRYLIGSFALLFGGYNIYKYFKNRKKAIGCEVTTDEQRSKLMERVKAIVNKKNLLLALGGTILLAISVNLIELACSTGYPAIFISMLSVNNLTLGSTIFYLSIYILFFLLDDLVIFSIAMITMNVTAVSNKYTNLVNIIGGIVMLLIGVLLILAII